MYLLIHVNKINPSTQNQSYGESHDGSQGYKPTFLEASFETKI